MKSYWELSLIRKKYNWVSLYWKVWTELSPNHVMCNMIHLTCHCKDHPLLHLNTLAKSLSMNVYSEQELARLYRKPIATCNKPHRNADDLYTWHFYLTNSEYFLNLWGQGEIIHPLAFPISYKSLVAWSPKKKGLVVRSTLFRGRSRDVMSLVNQLGEDHMPAIHI